MAAAAVASQVNSATGSGSILTVSFPASSTAGNFCGYGIASDDDGSGNFNIGVTLALDANFLHSEMEYLNNCPATTNTLTWLPNASANISLSCQEYSGVDTATPLDKTKTGTGFGTAASSGASATLTQADELVVVVTAATAALTFTAGATYTERKETGGVRSHQLEDKTVAVTTAVTGDSTLSTSSNWHCILATFKAGASAPPVDWTVTNRGKTRPRPFAPGVAR
jgi:hypothetical protein